ncbi:MBL fold metallo-hydrolase [bacterium]|nr:MBL fold metallo-hydrolase [bacterium]
MRLGDITLTVLDAETFLYDGGAMFGVVPRVIWDRLLKPDAENRIKLAVTPLLITTPDSKILVDTGFGTRLSKKERKIFGLGEGRDVESALKVVGVEPEEIDTVVLTHLHIDHAGGATRHDGDKLVPAFPNARYLVHELEWEDGLEPNVMSAAAYRRDDYVPLMEAGVLELIGDERDLGHGVTTVLTGGHCRGHIMVVAETSSGTAVYPADLIPSRHHFRAAYVAGVDLFPLDVVEQKMQLLEAAAREDWILILDHDPDGAVGRVIEVEDGRYRFEELTD